MKNLYISTCLLTLMAVVPFSVIAQQDTIANPGFEQWGTNPFYDDVLEWTTLNPLAQVFGVELAFRATAAGEFNSGTSAIKLVTQDIPGIGVTPSILTNGSVNTATQNVEGGVEVASRPLAFSFSYRFDALGSDTASFNVTFTKFNSVTGMSEIVGDVGGDLGNSNSSWVDETLNIIYYSQDVPDSALILFNTGTPPNVTVGTSLFLDDFAFVYSGANVQTPDQVDLSIYPNPASDQLFFSLDQSFKPIVAKLYDVNGRLVTTSIVLGKNSISLEGLVSGVYFIELESTDDQIVRQRFIKN